MQNVNINSEIGELEAVIIHTPGQEVEKMTPVNAERALYSDILNLSVANDEYSQFKQVLQQYTTTYEVKDLLSSILKQPIVKNELLQKVCESEGAPELTTFLQELDNKEAARQLIEGVEIKRDTLSKYLSSDRYNLRPLHNFLFTRDTSISMHNKVLIGKMASKVRERESIIMDYIFRYHKNFGVETLNPSRLTDTAIKSKIKIEGGDVLIARNNVLVIGTGIRTSTQGIDYITEAIRKQTKEHYHVIVQELPETPESFIHLDMVFTFLDTDTCMVYEPLIMEHNRYRTIHVEIDNGKVKSISTKPNLVVALNNLNFDLRIVKCGGNDSWHQEREQWHSGANFFAIAPGAVIGYERNVYTIDALSKSGFNVISAKEIIDNKLPKPTSKTVITIAGAELARGGGGARCMSMPIKRKDTFV